MSLNYNHLRYFWFVAHEGNLTRAAENLHIAQSALSIQIKTLETQMNHKLFERKGRQLILTEAGRIALDYADEIFKTGNELFDLFKNEDHSKHELVKIGEIPTLSRNFQMQFLSPLLEKKDIQIKIVTENINTLIEMLEAHELDVVLTNNVPTTKSNPPWIAHLISDQPVSLIAKPVRKRRSKNLAKLLSEEPLNLPSYKSAIRYSFDSLIEKLAVKPNVAVEVDDMAVLRLVALQGHGLTLVPSIVVKDELKSKKLIELKKIEEIRESFYAIVMKRKFENKLVQNCIESALLETSL